MSRKQERFHKYLNMYQNMVLKNASRYVGYHLAQDVAQETFLKMFLHIDYLNDEKIKPWLLVVSANVAKDYMKKLGYDEETEKNLIDRISDVDMEEGSPEDFNVKKETAHELLRTVFEILYEKNPTWYYAMLDSYVLEMSSKEIASVLNLTAGNVDVIKARAKKHLNKVLGAEYKKLFS